MGGESENNVSVLSGRVLIGRQIRDRVASEWMTRCEDEAIRADAAEQALREVRAELAEAREKIAALEGTIAALQPPPDPEPGTELTGEYPEALAGFAAGLQAAEPESREP